MKSEIKRALFVGMSLALVALAARRSRHDAQIEADKIEADPIEKPPMKANQAGLTPAPGLKLGTSSPENSAGDHHPGLATGFETPAHLLGNTFVSRPGNGFIPHAPDQLRSESGRMLSGPSVISVIAPTVTFSGTVVRSGPRFALRETAGVLYPLDSAGRAWPYEGEDVRITGKLDLDSRLLYVDAIEPSAL